MPHRIPFSINVLFSDLLLLLQMTLFADGVVTQEDFVQQVLVPRSARGAGAGVLRTGEHDLVFDCVAAFGDSGFGFAHFSVGGSVAVSSVCERRMGGWLWCY